MSRLFQSMAIAASTLVIAGCSTLGGTGGSSDSQSTVTEQAKLAGDAQTALQLEMSQPDAKRIPNQLVANARCIAVFPSVVKAGFIVGGQHGKGLVTCRQESGGFKSANPAVVSLSGGSIGLQAGAQASSIILLFETQQSVAALLQPEIKFGSQLSVTAGPSGYNHPITQSGAAVVAYVLSQKGLYAGVDLSGSKMSFNQSANDSLYGASTTPRGVLLGSMRPAGAMASFKQTLARFAPTGHQGSGGNEQKTQQSGSNQSQSQTNGGQQQSGSNQSQMNNSGQQSGSNQSGMNSGEQQSGSSQSQMNNGQQQSSGNQSQMNGGQQQSQNQSGMNESQSKTQSSQSTNNQ